MNLKKIFLLLAVSAVCKSSSAQQIITFENSKKSSKQREVEEIKRSVSVGLLSPFSGYLPFYYEQRLTDFLSIQAGAGVTFRSYMNDFGMMIWNDGKSDDGGYGDVEDQYYHYKYRKASLGYYFSLSPKIYYTDDCMDGFYIAPSFEWKFYRYKAQLADETVPGAYVDDDRDLPRIDDVMKENMNCFDVTLKIGEHYESKKNVIIGWSLGAGIRKISGTRLNVYTEDDGTGTYYYRNGENKLDGVRPYFTFNFTIGGCF